jgi:hypothetical protein
MRVQQAYWSFSASPNGKKSVWCHIFFMLFPHPSFQAKREISLFSLP